MSDAERVEATSGETEEIAASEDGTQRIRAEINEAKAATDRFRTKATELIAELRDRESKAREDAIAARSDCRRDLCIRLWLR